MKCYKHSSYDYITIVQIPKEEIQQIDMDVCSQPRQTLKNYYDNCQVKPAILCNGGFFSMTTGEPTFNYKDDYVILSTDISHRKGMGTINNELTYGLMDQYPFEDFVSAYPVLIENGCKVKVNTATELNYKARRTILAYNGLYVYIIAIESPGMTFVEMQDILMGLNVDYAINLDGGGSTKVLHNGKSLTSTLYNRAVDNIIAIYLKPQKIYRVQAGAFKTKTNAEKLLKKLKGLPNCSSAFIVKNNGLYKVQIGAYSNKLNANNMANILKANGYQTYIVVS